MSDISHRILGGLRVAAQPAPAAVEDYSILHLVGDAVGVLDGLGVDRAVVVVVGHDALAATLRRAVPDLRRQPHTSDTATTRRAPTRPHGARWLPSVARRRPLTAQPALDRSPTVSARSP